MFEFGETARGRIGERDAFQLADYRVESLGV